LFTSWNQAIRAEGEIIMNARACRDCGYLLEPKARGCPQCALNVEAESMIDRFIWWRFIPALIILMILTAALLFYWLQ